MPRQSRAVEGLIPGSCKIRKRGCSSSSSTSSVLQNYRFKRAILVGKTRGSRSSTPVPAWRTMSSALRAAESPNYAPSLPGGGKSRPVSARKLAATLWEMNEIPSPGIRENLDEKKLLKREMRVTERMGTTKSLRSGSFPPHLSDPSHSPVSERMDHSGTSVRQRRQSSVSQRYRPGDHSVGVLDSFSSASIMEIETRSRAQTPSGSLVGVKSRLKDVSNALTTSKELLKIINRIWGHDDQPSSSMSLISALHAELERARLQVNQVIHEQLSDQNEINYLMKCFAEEKAAWKKKEQQVIEAAIDSIAGELEVERKLRRRFESLNKKLGKELADTKASLLKAVKQLDSEKRAREIMEQVCDELARDIDEDKAEVEELKRESAKIHEEVEKEREMLQLADLLREERVQMKLSEAKLRYEEKNAVVDKLKDQLEAVLMTKTAKEKRNGSLNCVNSEKIAAYLRNKVNFGSHQNEEKEGNGEVEDGVECEEESAESDLHSIELNIDNNNKSHKYKCLPGAASMRAPNDVEIKGRNSVSGKAARRSTSLQRSISDGVDWGFQTEGIQNSGDELDLESYEAEKHAQRKGYRDDMQRHKSLKGLRDQILSASKTGPPRDFASPTRQWGQSRPPRDSGNTVLEKPIMMHGTGSKLRLVDAGAEVQNGRRSKRGVV